MAVQDFKIITVMEILSKIHGGKNDACTQRTIQIGRVKKIEKFQSVISTLWTKYSSAMGPSTKPSTTPLSGYLNFCST